jgi:hypothetical protein
MASFDPDEEIDWASLLWASILARRYDVLLCLCLERVGTAVVVVSIDTTVVGVPSLVRGRRKPPVMVICEGRDLSVWISRPAIDRIDS